MRLMSMVIHLFKSHWVGLNHMNCWEWLTRICCDVQPEIQIGRIPPADNTEKVFISFKVNLLDTSYDELQSQFLHELTCSRTRHTCHFIFAWPSAETECLSTLVIALDSCMCHNENVADGLFQEGDWSGWTDNLQVNIQKHICPLTGVDHASLKVES